MMLMSLRRCFYLNEITIPLRQFSHARTQALDEASKKFTEKEIIPVAAHYDRTGEFPWPIIKKAQYVSMM